MAKKQESGISACRRADQAAVRAYWLVANGKPAEAAEQLAEAKRTLRGCPTFSGKVMNAGKHKTAKARSLAQMAIRDAERAVKEGIKPARRWEE